jgi:putative oxidoreductase
MAYGLLLLRVVTGGLLLGHGLQKTFGWWNGPGPKGVHGWLASMGFRFVALMTLLLILAEDGGLLFAVGLVTPLAALMIVSSQFVAIMTTHCMNGFWTGNGGYAFTGTLTALATAIAATGPGRFSLDRWLGLDDNWSGVWWGAGVLVVGFLSAALIVTVLRRPPAPEEPAAS